MESPHTPDNWNAAAADYDQTVTRFTTLFADDLLDRLEPSSSCATIEVAAGPGNVTVRVARRCRRVLATDYSTGMIERLRMRLENEQVTNVDCAVMDGTALDVEDGTFDRAVSSFGVMLFRDRAAGFSELYRALRPGGRVAVSGWSTPDKFEPFGLFGQAVQRAVPELPTPDQPPPIFSLADPARFKSEMENAGFTDVRVDHVTHIMEQPSKEAYWELMSNGAPPARVLFARIGEKHEHAVRDTLFEILDERFGNTPLRLSAEATIGYGRR